MGSSAGGSDFDIAVSISRQQVYPPFEVNGKVGEPVGSKANGTG